MPMQFWNKVFLGLIVLTMLASPACKPSETVNYAKQLDLPEENKAIVKRLQWDSNTKALMDELAALPKNYRVSEAISDYLTEVAADKIVQNDELLAIQNAGEISILDISDKVKMDNITLVLNSPEARNAYDSLKSYPDDTIKSILEFGLDGDVPAWVALNSTLPKGFSDYVIKSKLCIQDKRLTADEKQFLQDPDKYLQEMYEYNISQIAAIDPELAIKLKQIPFLQDGIELKDVESLEDILYLANDPENKPKLEKIYGKGIERKMWPVTLERVFYKGFENEFDIDNPFEGSEWYVNSNLAEFQEKYNKEMDQDRVPGPKPAIRGVNLLHEPNGNQMTDYNGRPKSVDDLKFEYALIRWVLRCNAVRLYCGADYDVFVHVKLAQDEDLCTWLLFFPLFVHPDIDEKTYKSQLTEIARKAEKNNVPGLFVGAEFDAWWNIWGGYAGDPTQYNLNNERLKKCIGDLVEIVRKNYSGLITYQEWDCWYNFDKNLNWDIMDAVSASPYIGSYNKQFLNDQLYLDIFKNIKSKYNKPVVIAEVGSLTISESEEAGGRADYVLSNPYHYDQEKQAEAIDRHLNLLYQADVDGIFLCCWDEPVHHPWGDMNKLGFGIWDYANKEPKPSFWVVYKYYKD